MSNSSKPRSVTKVPARLLKNPLHFLSLGFGTGLAPWAPGTFGTLAGLGVYLLAPPLDLPTQAIVIVVSTLLGIGLCGYTAQVLKTPDHPGIVWDEMVGIWITLYAAPAGWPWVIAGFALFRLLDIVKPWPIRVLDQRLKGGLGIMLDDVLAGLIALAVLQGVANYIHT